MSNHKIGAFATFYETVIIDPQKLQAYHLTLKNCGATQELKSESQSPL
jgi:hypothetical protein